MSVIEEIPEELSAITLRTVRVGSPKRELANTVLDLRGSLKYLAFRDFPAYTIRVAVVSVT
jgi:hypothetical protein